MKRMLVTGALGQIGSELVPALRARFGADAVVASDIRMLQKSELSNEEGPSAFVDVTDIRHIQDTVRRFDIGTIYHLAAVLSAVAEDKPQVAWDINMGGLYAVLEVAREYGCALFVPSSIGAFGLTTPPDFTPQDTIQRPTSMYGVTKVAGELLGDYYYKRFGVDCRGLRFPGLISYIAPPGGGTTDYAVEIYYAAVRHEKYTCFLRGGTKLDMMYMPDATRAIADLMIADSAHFKHRNSFNVTAMSVTPELMAASIREYLPDFEMEYDVDPVRQAIADSWPNSLDDTAAREEWGWKPEYNLASMTRDMLEKLTAKLNVDDA